MNTQNNCPNCKGTGKRLEKALKYNYETCKQCGYTYKN